MSLRGLRGYGELMGQRNLTRYATCLSLICLGVLNAQFTNPKLTAETMGWATKVLVI